MADAAYIVFFATVFVGGASFLHLSLAREWQRIAAAWRGEWFEDVQVTATAGQVSVSERPQPVLAPVSISICRI